MNEIERLEAENARLRAENLELWARAQFPDPRPDTRAIFALGDKITALRLRLKEAVSTLERVYELLIDPDGADVLKALDELEAALPDAGFVASMTLVECADFDTEDHDA